MEHHDTYMVSSGRYTSIFICVIIKRGVIKLFEIKKTSSSNKTIRMPDSLIEKLERLAAKNDISFNQLVIQCCEYAIENLVSQN